MLGHIENLQRTRFWHPNNAMELVQVLPAAVTIHDTAASNIGTTDIDTSHCHRHHCHGCLHRSLTASTDSQEISEKFLHLHRRYSIFYYYYLMGSV